MIKVEVVKPKRTRQGFDISYDLGTKALGNYKTKIETETKGMACQKHPKEATVITLSFNGNVEADTVGCCSDFEKEIVARIKAL